ncbi:DUF2264 domain-containing protein [Pedobacter heparinus]|uniref:DUF2264 domain-containing protein n=1 Tax=Pedobacter heparinus (strain ATCC 13125 / DSM 2366 / CIP 104194 / JCM 7457 / NBRC 12017 / NCIMB 9290 / NRRL B-14731 / HIM 762-3) TaxID=485917 RepID=C6XSG5_PEDHD|nr:DUF2264 domain-containing protein [Pedobacter heparinus]ACU03510.1 conserved hypothetical protein [Pedobacter heparinus DSM 2366]
MYKKLLIVLICASPQWLWAQKNAAVPDGLAQRAYEVTILTRIADPVLIALSKNQLKSTMPVEAKVAKDRVYSTYLEAFGRLLAGMSPWLELGPDNTEEGKLRKKYIDLAVACIKNATDPKAADFLNFKEGRQPLVDAAFFAQALIRAPKQLWANLDSQTRKNVLDALRSSRVIQPSYTNWLMFSATVEAALQKYDNSGDKMRLDYAIKEHLLWYKGDGVYGDGPNFHWDYYNSFVIQPMLVDVLKVLKEAKQDPKNYYELILGRAQRWAAIQERLISPEGTYPPIGRSLTYRFGAFQALAQMSLMKTLPKPLTPGQVRYALYTVIKKQIEAPGTFDKDGWLRIGLYGHQPNLGENYISTGSLYLCSQGLLALGLPPADPYWQDANADWTARKAWNGEMIEIDHAYTDPKEN